MAEVSKEDEVINVKSEVVSERTIYEEIKSLGITIAHITIVIIILGFIYQIIYYGFYKIPIKYFISVSEFGLLVSDEILRIIPFFVLSFGYHIFGKYVSEKYQRLKSFEENERHKKNTIAIFQLGNIGIIITLSLTLLFTSNEISRTKVLGFGMMYIPVAIIIFYTKAIVNNFSFYQYFLLFGLFYFIGNIIINTSNDVYYTNNGKYNGTFIHLKDDRCYTSNDTTFFIGKTDKYVFFHNKKDTSNIIIPTDDIKTFILKMK